MLAKIAAAIGILVLAGLSPVSADPWWGQQQRRRQQYRRRYYDRHDPRPGAFWGGVLGGLLGQALRPDRQGRDVEGDEDRSR